MRHDDRAAFEERRVRERIERHPVEGSAEDMRRAFHELVDLPLDAEGVGIERGAGCTASTR